MSAGWVAAQVRSRSLTSRCVGPAGARDIARSGSLSSALEVLATTSYGERLESGLSLEEAERALFETALWNLRVLAGWSPALGASRLRVLAGGFELANIRGELARIEGHQVPIPYDLGSLASVPRHRQSSSIVELRESLKRSPWGDPGALESPGILVALQISLARRVVENVPEASVWAEGFCALVLARLVIAGTSLASDSVPDANARAVLGRNALHARTLHQLGAALPIEIAAVLEGATGPEDLWTCEARWWNQLWRSGEEGVRRGGAEPATVVAAVAAMYADVWRIRAALEIAARAGRGIELLDAVA
jgi:hypothetical protein